MSEIYFDNAATTHPKPEIVKTKMKELIDTGIFNIGRGSYKEGKFGLDLYESTKDKIATLCNGELARVKFSASATIAFNELIYSMQISKGATIYITPFEHNAVVRTLMHYSKEKDFKIELIPYDKDLKLETEKFQHMCLINPPDFIFLNHVSNVIGNIINIEAIVDITKSYKPCITVDVSQSFGLIEIDIQRLAVDYIVFAGHKTLYGPLGIAGIVSREKFARNKMLLHGGTGSDSLNIDIDDAIEVGSPNILAIAGLNAAIDWINDISPKAILNHEQNLRKRFIAGLKDIYDIKIYGENISEDEMTGITSFHHNGYSPDELGQILDLDFDIAVRTGFHCAPYIHELIESKQNAGTIRVSFSWFNTEDEVDKLIEILEGL